MKNSLLYLLPLALAADLLIPFALAPSFQGYRHAAQVMSVLGSRKAPLHMWYNGWLILLGCIILAGGFRLYPLVARQSAFLASALFLVLAVYAVGGCILSGIFSVDETKQMVTASAKIHGYGSVIGFLCLTLAPLLISLSYFSSGHRASGAFSLACFLLAVLFFTLFVMADKDGFRNTWIACEGAWQRLTLLFMYLPVGLLCISAVQ